MNELSSDELFVVFSFLSVRKDIKNLTLVCKHWYYVASVKNGTDSALWKIWYHSMLDYYTERNAKYKRNWMKKRFRKKKNKQENRNYRVLLYSLIINSEKALSKKKDQLFDRTMYYPFKDWYWVGELYYTTVENKLAFVMEQFTANKKRLAYHLVETEQGKLIVNRMIHLIGQSQSLSDQTFYACVNFAIDNNIPINNSERVIAQWNGDWPSSIRDDIPSFFLPTHLLIIYGHFELAKILHEKHGCPLSLKINETVILTSMNVLIQRQSIAYSRVVITDKEMLSFLEYLIEKEQIPSHFLHLQQCYLTGILKQENMMLPLTALTQGYQQSCTVPMMRMILDRGENVNRRGYDGKTVVEWLYEYLYQNQHNYGFVQWYSPIFKKMMQLFQEYNAEEYKGSYLQRVSELYPTGNKCIIS